RGLGRASRSRWTRALRDPRRWRSGMGFVGEDALRIFPMPVLLELVLELRCRGLDVRGVSAGRDSDRLGRLLRKYAVLDFAGDRRNRFVGKQEPRTVFSVTRRGAGEQQTQMRALPRAAAFCARSRISIILRGFHDRAIVALDQHAAR